MKKTLLSTIIFISNLYLYSQYNYKFQVSGAENDTVYLANYYAGKLYMNDTTVADSKGNFSFFGKEKKENGLYAIVMNDKKSFFDIIINEPSFTIKTKKSNLNKYIKIEKSKENQLFKEYKEFVESKFKLIMDARKEIDSLDNKGKIKELKNKIKKLNEDVQKYRINFVDKYKNFFVGKLMKMTIEPIIPKNPNPSDSNYNFRYYKDHYFDNFDLKNDDLLRTPILTRKIDEYFTKLVTQMPDSICSEVFKLIKKLDEKSDIFKYLIISINSRYQKSKLMGMDAVFICIAEKIYTQGKAFWIDSTKLTEIIDRYNILKNLVIGKKAENVILPDSSNKWHSLYNINTKYTILYFWSPTCGICKKELPKVEEFYQKWKNKGYEIYGVCTELEWDKCKKIIKEKNLEFLNVSDSKEINKNAWKYINSGLTTLNSLNFRDYWDIYSTPQLYLLDKNKKILGKKIAIDQIPDFIKIIENKK